MDKYLSISKASDMIGVSESTLRRWEKEKRLIPDGRTAGNQRRYLLSSIRPEVARKDHKSSKVTLCYARVSARDQKKDLDRQKNLLELFCASQGWQFEIISDLGSGMNYHKKGLKKLLHEIVNGRVQRLVLTHKDRLLRFGAELVFSLCELKGIEVLILNQSKEKNSNFEEDLTQDVLEILTVFSARLYGARSKKNQKLMDGIQGAISRANRAQNQAKT